MKNFKRAGRKLPYFKDNVALSKCPIHNKKNVLKAGIVWAIAFVIICCVLFSSLAISGTVAQTQSSTVLVGVVRSAADGQAIEGVTIQSLPSGRFVITDKNGKFSITRQSDKFLKISYLGFVTKQIAMESVAMNPAIMLETDIGNLDEVIAIGYGTTTKRLNTGSSGRITSQEIGSQPIVNVMEALSGRIPGVYVKMENGLPGGAISIAVRGRSSIQAGTDPLYIIDGVPMDSSPLNAGNADFQNLNGLISPLNSLSPNDIESIEVLKDADATAIYGSRGANGVILITTKSGKDGVSKLDFAVRTGISAVSLMPEVVDFDTYKTLRYEAYANDKVEPNETTAPDLLLWEQDNPRDWGDWLMGRKAPSIQYNASLIEKSDHARFRLSLSRLAESTVISAEQKYEKNGATLNYELNPKDSKVQLNVVGTYSKDKNNTMKMNSFVGFFSYAHNYPLIDEHGNYNWWLPNNPLSQFDKIARTSNEYLAGSMVLTYRIFPGLQFKNLFGLNRTALSMFSSDPALSNRPSANAEDQSNFGNNTANNTLIEPQIDYAADWGNTTFKAMLGGTWQMSENDGSSVRGVGYSSTLMMESLEAAQRIDYKYNNYSQYKYLSGYARVNLQHLGRYVVNLSYRRDGSSRFGKANRFGDFGALGLAWIFSDEAFLKDNVPLISYGKLRASYGITGNDQIGDYAYLTSYKSNNLYGNRSALIPKNIYNDQFGWETTRKTDIGLELGLFKQRLLMNVGYFHHLSDNQLIAYPLPALSGPFGSYQSNFGGKVRNTGLEAELSGYIVNRDHIKWNSSINMTWLKNKLLSFPGIEKTTYANKYEVGQDLSIVYGYNFLGINTNTGIPEYRDVNKDGVINSPHDRVVITKGSPDSYGGWRNTVEYKNFSFDLFIQFVEKESRVYVFGYLPGRTTVPSSYALKRWRQPGDITDVPLATTTVSTPQYKSVSDMNNSSAAVVNGSFLRGKSLAVQYRFEDAWTRSMGLKQLSLGVSAQNFFTLFDDKKSRRDPETSDWSSRNMPLMKTLALELKVTL